MKTITSCTKPKVSEAWATIIGYPSKLNEEEIAAINNEAHKTIEHIRREPSIVLFQKDNLEKPAFWTSQFSYKDDLYKARTGHKYLSVHIVPKSEQSGKEYTGYDKCLQPEIEKWINIYRKILNKPKNFNIEGLSFGYVNTFIFDENNFDVAKYFKINLGLDIGNNDALLADLSSSYKFFDENLKMHFSVSLAISPVVNQKKLELKTQIQTEKKGIQDLTIEDTEKIHKAILDLKEENKKIFFSFSTSKTHEEMGAK